MTDGRARRLDGSGTRMLKIAQKHIMTEHVHLARIYEDMPLFSSSCVLRQLRAILSTFHHLDVHPLCDLLLHPLGRTLVAGRQWSLRATISENWNLPLTDIPVYAHGDYEDFISSRAYAHEVQARRNVIYRSMRASLSKIFANIVQQNAASLAGDEDTPELIPPDFLKPLTTPQQVTVDPPTTMAAETITIIIHATRAPPPPDLTETLTNLTTVTVSSDVPAVAKHMHIVNAPLQDAVAIATCEILSELPLVPLSFITSFKMFPKQRRMYRRQNRKHIVWKMLYRLILERDAKSIPTTFTQAPRPSRPREASE